MLNLDRHNYETFFLLYVDGELSPLDRTAVESFVKQNPDLSKELESLQQAVLMPDTFNFDKSHLYKSVPGITINNYEEYFCLSVDNELTETEKNDVEKFVLQHPDLQEAFTLLHATKLPVVDVVFDNKESLYRTSKERRIIPFTWLRMGAAAAVLMFVAGMWLTKSTNSEIASPGTNVTAAKSQEENKKTPADTETKILNEAQPVVAALKIDKKSESKAVATNFAVATKKAPLDNVIQPLNIKTQQKPVLLPPTEQMLTALIDKSKTGDRTKVPVEMANPGNTTNTALASTAVNTNTEPPVTTHAVYKEMNDDNEDDHTLYIGSAELNSHKIKSLLKKASSLFGKGKNNDDENTINIANFQLKGK